MHRRALLAGLGAAAGLAGCSADLNGGPTSSELRDVYNPTGRASARPIDDPLIRGGITASSEQYLYARMFHPGDSLAVTGESASWLSEGVDELSEGQFALLTCLRTAATAPAHWWPKRTEYADGRFRIGLERQSFVSAETDAAEAVGVALTTFEYDGERPDSADVVYPSGATVRVGSKS
jgi:hypothetical protein